MNSNFPFYAKKDLYINDSNDISCVNDFSDKSSFDIVQEILSGSIFVILPILSLLIIHSSNIFILSLKEHEDNHESLVYYMIFINYLYFFGFIFTIGSLKFFDFYFKNDEITYEKKEVNCLVGYIFSRNLILLVNIIIIIPICFLSYLILTNFYSDETSKIYLWDIFINYTIYTPFSFYFMMNLQLNFQVLQNFKKNQILIYLFFEYILFYLIMSYILLYFTRNILLVLSLNLFFTNIFSFLISHFILVDYIYCMNNLNLNVFYYFLKIKWENFWVFFKLSSLKGLLFNFRYFGIGLIIFSSLFIEKTYLISTIVAINMIAYPHLFAFGISKYYKNHLELTVFNHSHNSKKRYLKFFWIIIFSSCLIFGSILMIFKIPLFNLILNLKDKIIINNPNDILIENIYSHLIQYYLYFIIFDFLSNAFEGLLKGLDEHSRNYLSFYKGISLILIFIPFGIGLCYSFKIFIFWAYWIAIYLLMIIYPLILFVILYKNHRNSIFPFSK